MPTRAKGTSPSHKDVLHLMDQIRDEYGVRIRISVVQLNRVGTGQDYALLATPYDANGRRLIDVTPEQLLWPSKAHKTFDGACIYMLTALSNELAYWEAAKMRDLSHLPHGALSPLEEYIANTPLTSPEG